jgi:hypothetical protein
VYKLLVGKPPGKRPLRRQRHRWVDNIKSDFAETGSGGVDWVSLVQQMNKWKPLCMQ